MPVASHAVVLLTGREHFGVTTHVPGKRQRLGLLPSVVLVLVPPCAFMQENPELDAIWRLLQYFWNKHYQGIWQALQGYQWSQQVCVHDEAACVSICTQCDTHQPAHITHHF